MQKVFPTNKKKFGLSFKAATAMPTNLKIVAYDKNKPHTYYYNTAGKVDSKGRQFDLKFPLSPDELVVQIYPDKFKNYQEYQRYGNPMEKNIAIGDTKLETLKSYPIWLSNDDREFIKFAEWFSSNAGILSATQANNVPSIYKSTNGKFEIHYFDVILNKDGGVVGTPARIGHNSGIIEISKRDFLRYTVQGRMAILLHEYAHKYINPRKGLKPQDEVGADINALNIYLSLGYSPIEAHLVFLKVFQNANNEFNHKRYLILNDFIQKFMAGQLDAYHKPHRGFSERLVKN